VRSSSLLRQLALLLGLAFLPGIGQAIYYRNQVSWQTPPRSPDEITLAQAESWGAKTFWLDARADDQFARDHIPGALLLNEDRWNELLPAALAAWTPERNIVVYCSSEACHASRQIARRLREETGLKNVYVLSGGWEAWQQAKR
jgi:rhodanese-related sulfurtransferase